MESFDVPRIIHWKGMLFRRMIHGKFLLSVNYPAERHAFPQGILRKVTTSVDFTVEKTALTQNNLRLHALCRGIIRGKFRISKNYTPETHALPRYNLRNVLPFRR